MKNHKERNVSIIDEQNRTLKKVQYVSVAALSLGVGAYFGIPALKTAYHKHKAQQDMEVIEKEIGVLERTLGESRGLLEINNFILTGNEESEPLCRIINHNTEELSLVQEELQQAKNSFVAEKYRDIRLQCEEEYELPEGNTRLTPRLRAVRAKHTLDEKVISYLRKKRKLRDTVLDNEYTFTARLMSPLGVESDESLENLKSELPLEYHDMIAVNSKGWNMHKEFGSQASNLDNSLGINLLTHKGKVKHIQDHAKAERIKDRAESMYREAFDAYVLVVPQLSTVIRYRPSTHDGTFSYQDYLDVLERQEVVINSLTAGDNSLDSLDAYDRELHNQYYVYVSDNPKVSKRFRHTKVVMKTRHYTDSNGHHKTRTVPDTETYYTHGYEYFFTETTVKPSGTSSVRKYVGEKDSQWLEYDYPSNQEKGYVIEWKRLHEDNAMITRGGRMSTLKPHIESLSASCKDE